MSTPTQSNQTAGAGKRSCLWCQAWNAAFAASRLPEYDARPFQCASEKLRAAGLEMVALLARRNPGTCEGCQRSAEIYFGDILGDEWRAWRAEMWATNPSMRFMMRAGKGETFQEDQA